MSWLNEFPSLGSEQLSAMRRSIDGVFRGFTREYGEPLERLFDPLRDFLLFSERGPLHQSIDGRYHDQRQQGR